VPSAVTVSPVQAPLISVGPVAQLGHAYLGPFGQVRAPRPAGRTSEGTAVLLFDKPGGGRDVKSRGILSVWRTTSGQRF
jgi:hypothetical protein